MPSPQHDLIKPGTSGMSAAPQTVRFEYPLDGDVDGESSPHVQFYLQKFLAFLLRFWWVVLITFSLAMGAAGAFVYWKPPTFVSSAAMWEAVKLRLPEGSLFTEEVQTFLGTQSELLQSPALNDLALSRLRSASNSVTIPRDSEGKPLPVHIRVSQASKSAVFVLTATSADAAYVQNYLDALMAVYFEYKKNIRRTVSGDTLASITEQVQRAERDLKDEQDSLTSFQRTNNLAILQEEGTIAGGYLARLKTQLSDYQLEHRLLTAASADATNQNPVALSSLASLTGQPSSSTVNAAHQATLNELEVLKIQRQKLSRYLRPKHPKVSKLDADIDRGEKLVEIYNRQGRDQLTASLQGLAMRIENVQASIREWERKVIDSNSRIAEAERLKLNVQRTQGVYERLAMLLQNVGISRNIDQETLSILQPASPAQRSFKQEISAVGMAGVTGLGLGLGIIFLLAVRDDRFSSFLEVNEKLGHAVVGQVPELKSLGNGSGVPLLATNDSRHAYAESYRSLRSALMFMDTGSDVRPKVILITSAIPDEGKSTVAANLARTLAQGGSRVVLVDADLRKGALCHLLKLQRSPGLSELLRDPKALDRTIQRDTLENFSFISGGAAIFNSGDLFLGPGFDQILARLRERFDYVLIDSSPVFAADDAATLAPKTDGTLFVVRSRFSGARLVREAMDLLRQRQAKVLGVIFNRADASARSYYYHKYADYHSMGKAESEELKAES